MSKSNAIVVSFETPVMVAGKEVSQISARQPIMRDIKIAAESYNASEQPVAFEMLLVANLLGISERECEELPPAVYNQIRAVVQPFLG